MVQESLVILQVQQFVGLASYCKRFIQNFASIARPLHYFTERGRPFKLCKRSSPILVFSYFSLPFILDVNACQSGIDTVLSQEQKDGKERVIAYAIQNRKSSALQKRAITSCVLYPSFLSNLSIM